MATISAELRPYALDIVKVEEAASQIAKQPKRAANIERLANNRTEPARLLSRVSSRCGARLIRQR